MKATNLALGKPAKQSSVSPWSRSKNPGVEAGGGNNGKITGSWGFHTDREAAPWWQVDLQGIFEISNVTLYNRLTNRERLRYFTLLFSLDGVTWAAAFQKTDSGVFGGNDGNPLTIEFEPGFHTRHVRVRLDATDYLHFDEIEIFGTQFSGDPATLRLKEIPVEKRDYPVYLINLDHDTARLARVLEWAGAMDVDIKRIGGVRAKYLPKVVSQPITKGRKFITPGMVGCLLSHIAIWESVVEGRNDNGLVLEDDAHPMIPLPDRFAAFGLPADYDLCFVNKGMTHDRGTPVASGFTHVPMLDAIRGRPKDQNGIGTDGYLVSRGGARNLLKYYGVDGMLGHLDWQLAAWGLTAAETAALPEDGKFFEVIKRYKGFSVGLEALKFYSMCPPLTRVEDGGFSTLRNEGR